MAGRCYLVALLLALALNGCFSDADYVHDDKVALPIELNALEYDTSTGYPAPEEEQKEEEEEMAPLSCYDCTSYMSSCKREVSDVGGQIVSRTGCKTKCFLRIGEEQSGALYRGCMDDFLSARALTQDYVGCQVQEWNGKKSLWCLCGDDLCNGQSLKALFYYGFGTPNKLQYLPDGKAYLVESVDDRFDTMTGNVPNYNPQYEAEPLHQMPLLEEPSPVRVDEQREDEIPQGYPVDTRPVEEPYYPEQLPEQHPYPQEQQPRLEELSKQPVYEGEQYPEEHQEEPQSYGKSQPGAYDDHPYGYAEEHHVPFPSGFPGYPITSPDQLPEEQYLAPPPHPEQYPDHPGAVPTYYKYPQYPGLSNKLKHPNGEENTVELNPEDSEGEQVPPLTRSPEGKSAVLPPLHPTAHHVEGGSFRPYAPRSYYPPAPGYPYHYGGQVVLEPLNYYHHGDREEQAPLEEPVVEEEQKVLVDPPAIVEEPTEEETSEENELDSELYCPAAGIFTYEEDCSKFVMCLIDHIHGKPRMYVMKCPARLVFDSVANTCMQPEMSDGCKRLPPPEPEVTSAPELYERPGRHEGYSDGYEASRVNQVFEYGY